MDSKFVQTSHLINLCVAATKRAKLGSDEEAEDEDADMEGKGPWHWT